MSAREKTTMRMPGMPAISKSPKLMGFSTTRSHSSSTVMPTPASTEPVMDPSPPVTTIMSTLKVRVNRNILGSMVVRRLASSAPPMPAKNEPTVKDKSL